jgi:putative phage-type endonuclease
VVKILNVVQGSQDWHDLRKIKLGASCAPIICGISPYSTPLELYQKMKGLINEDDNNDWAKERGKRLEKEAIQLFENTEQLKTFQPVGQSDIHDCLIASMDAVNVDDVKVCAEIKCLNIDDHSKTYMGDIPDIYFPQLQHQMFVFELEQIAYISYNPDALIEYTKTIIKRDDGWLAKYIPKALGFMSALMKNEPPQKTDRDWFDCKHDHIYERLELDYMSAYNAHQQAEMEKERCRKALIEYSGGRKVCGDFLKVSKYTKQGQVDYKKIPELQYINIDKFRGPSVESYRIDRVR